MTLQQANNQKFEAVRESRDLKTFVEIDRKRAEDALYNNDYVDEEDEYFDNDAGLDYDDYQEEEASSTPHQQVAASAVPKVIA